MSEKYKKWPTNFEIMEINEEKKKHALAIRTLRGKGEEEVKINRRKRERQVN